MVFGWLIGSSTERIAVDASKHDAYQPTDDAPDTPAPVFVARAFKSLLVGVTEPETPPSTLSTDEARTKTEQLKPPQRSGSPKKPLKSSLSPSKPSILSTPGLGTGKRKSVSFGGELKENERPSRSGLPNFPGKFPSPWTPKVENESQLPQDSVIDDIFASISGKASHLTKSSERTDAFKKQLGLVSAKEAPTPEEFVVDQPDSTLEEGIASFWRKELEKQTRKAETERKKLEDQKQMVKSYARKKDTEANDLSVQLREERKRVQVLDAEVNYLTAQLAHLGVASYVEDQDELVPHTEKTLKRKADYENLGQITGLSGRGSTRSALQSELDQLRLRLQHFEKENASLKAEKQLLNADLVRSRESSKRQADRLNAREQRFDEIEAEFMEQRAHMKQRIESMKLSHAKQVETMRNDKGQHEKGTRQGTTLGVCPGDCNEVTALRGKLQRATQRNDVAIARLKSEIEDLTRHRAASTRESSEGLSKARDEAAKWRIETSMLEATLSKKEREIERLRKQLGKNDPPALTERKPVQQTPLFDIAESDAGFDMLPTGSDAELESGIWDGIDQLDSFSKADTQRPKASPIDDLLNMSPEKLPQEDSVFPQSSPVRSQEISAARTRPTLPADRMAAAKARIAERNAAKRMMNGTTVDENQENWTP